MGEGQQNGVLPRGEGQSKRGHNKVKSLTLSDVKAPISPGEEKQLCILEPFLSKKCPKYKKQYNRKALLRSFYLNGHILGFHPQTQSYCTACNA